MVRWLLRGFATLVTLALLAVLVLVLVPTERVARLAADRIGAATGRAVTIEGPVRATLWPRLGVQAAGVEVANAPWSTEGPMLSAASMEVGIALGSLLGGDIRIETLSVDGARLVLERREDGVGNWEVAGPAPAGAVRIVEPSSADVAPREVTIGRAELTRSEVTWIDRAAGRQVHLRAVDLETRLDGLDAPIRVTASALLGDLAVKAEGSAAALRPFLDGALTPVTLSLASGGTTLALDGRADLDPLSFEGGLEAGSYDGFAALGAIGIPAPALPRGLGAGRAAVTATLTLAPAGTFHLRDVVADLDANRITGAVDIDPNGARPRVEATLAAGSLDLTATRSGEAATRIVGTTATVTPTARGWSRTPIDVAGLFAVDGEIAFESGPITLDGAVIDELRALVAIDDGRAVVTLRPLLAYGGTVTGDLVVNGRGGLSMRADIVASGLQMQPVLAALVGFDRLAGAADLSLGLLGIGDDIGSLVESLDGTIALRVGPGEILGLDILGMVRSLDLGFRGEGRSTVFDGLSISAAVAGGIARSDDLVLTAPYLTAGGEGIVDLGARIVDYRLLPTLRAEQDGEGLTVPVSIEGPWDDPTIRPDLEYIARQRFDLEREEIEARVREETDAVRARAEDSLRQRLAEELEVAPDALDGRDGLEDAIRGRVEDRLLDLLQNR